MRFLILFNKVGIKLWIELDSPNIPLKMLRNHVVKKIEKTSMPGEDGRVAKISTRERVLRINRESPAALAAEIMRLQIVDANKRSRSL